MSNMDKKRKPALIFQFKDDADLFDMLNVYRKSLGWTWMRFFLMGTAALIDKNNDNPDLIVRIADYLGLRR